MKAQNTPQQSFSDKQPKAIVKVIIGCLVLMLVGGSLGYAYIQKQKTSLTETVTIEDDEVAAGITEEVMKAVEERLVTITDENGNTVELDEEEMATLQTLCTAEILETLKGTDLMSLSNEQMQQLITNLKKNIIENVLKQSDLSQYFTENDYEEIAKYITRSSTTELGSIQKQITDNKQASEKRDTAQDNSINDIKSSIKDVEASVKENEKGSGSDISALKNDITNLNSSINDTNNNLGDAKTKLTDLINANTALDEATKTELTNKINAATLKTANDLTTLCNDLTAMLNELDDKYDVYFEVEFSVDVPWADGQATVGISNEHLKTYSDINVVYDDSCKIGYTVTYQQSDGSLQLSLLANANATPPATISGKLYIDNSMVNAQ
ncbi:MAG: hypothetical protein E7231_01045 [Cellulosilyticum sp.]|nr:hypothetical protein [Cellulosilyticum sp.]